MAGNPPHYQNIVLYGILSSTRPIITEAKVVCGAAICYTKSLKNAQVNIAIRRILGYFYNYQ